jgi:transcriptional regulator of acetoin/glycerol metabolism
MASPIHVPGPVLRQARLRLLEGHQLPAEAVNERVARSWQRSLAAGLVPYGQPMPDDKLSASDLRQSQACNGDLINHSRPVMEYLFEQVRHGHSMVVLSDRHGVLMHTLGDGDFLSKAERVALQAGARWSEDLRGTNAIGTALAEGCGVEIHGAEHYMDRNGFLTCAASPILSASGELMGILDISGDQRSHHPHTLGLVNTAARMIENRLFTAHCQNSIVLHMHPQTHGIGTVAAGMLAVSEDGWIMGANSQALRMLDMNRQDIGATPLARVLETRLTGLLAQAHQRGPQPLALRRHSGEVLQVTVQWPHGQRSSLRTSAAGHSTATTLSSESDALQALDTGDAAWRAAADKARRVAGKPISVLLHGESGVGKELFARAVHACSPRRHRPFVPINCAAIPEHLIEAELFGYTAGAFTGARKEGSLGRLREADGGTLFLDEIGDMPLSMQTRLLRVLQERQVTPLGGGVAVPVDFALICATHHRLSEDAETGRFRSDLYYRINGLTLNLPPLRQRSDFKQLTTKLLRELGGEPPVTLAPEVLQRLAAYPWPGNLRQYASVLRTALAMLDPGETVIQMQHLSDDLVQALQGQPPASPRAALARPSEHKLEDISRAAVQQALIDNGGNHSAAARQLGISRQTLYRKLS